MSVGTTILVADDDRAIRTVLHQALGRQGHTVRSTGAAATLWQWVQEGEGQLVITDVVMPDENGLDLVPRIRKLRPDLRIIARAHFDAAVEHLSQHGANVVVMGEREIARSMLDWARPRLPSEDAPSAA
mgnify:CR=1 FL=1